VPTSADAHYGIAICAARLGRLATALDEVSASLAIDPSYARARLLRTNQQLAVQKDLEDRLKASQGQLSDALNRELGTFNDMLRRANLPNVVSQVRRPSSQ
jgi:hypothetical protein